MSNSKSKNNRGSKKLSNDNLKKLTTLHAASIALVLVMFIFALLPAFTFKVTVDADEINGYSDNDIDEELESREKELNDAINDLLKINLLHPLSLLESEKLTDMLGIDEPSSEDVDILSIGYNISLGFAIIQSLFFLGTIVALVFALLKPQGVKVARVLPMILSICGIIYSLLFLAMFKVGVYFLGGTIDEAKLDVLLTFAGWAYLIASIALLVVTVTTNKTKKRLKI